jgi:hypothetical protein
MQILCQPFSLLNPLVLCTYYVLKIRRLQCYKYTLRSYSRMGRRSDFKILKIVGILMQAISVARARGGLSSIFAASQILESILSG